jgi:small GTP-binding protein
MIQKKVCMLGSFSVGKTSLVRRYVESVFSEQYLSTVGVKVDRKVLTIQGKEISLIIWDIEGGDEKKNRRGSYLRGASGVLLVVDGTRKRSLDDAVSLYSEVESLVGKIPGIFVINKSDLRPAWEVQDSDLELLRKGGFPVFEASAKENSGIDLIFGTLGSKLLLGMS